MRIDYDYKQVIDSLKVETKEDVDKAIDYIKAWFFKDELRYVNQIIQKLEEKQQLLQSESDSILADHIQRQLTENYEVKYQKTDSEVIHKALDVFEQIGADDSSWSKFINGDDLKIWYRKEEQ